MSQTIFFISLHIVSTKKETGVINGTVPYTNMKCLLHQNILTPVNQPTLVGLPTSGRLHELKMTNIFYVTVAHINTLIALFIHTPATFVHAYSMDCSLLTSMTNRKLKLSCLDEDI